MSSGAAHHISRAPTFSLEQLKDALWSAKHDSEYAPRPVEQLILAIQPLGWSEQQLHT